MVAPIHSKTSEPGSAASSARSASSTSASCSAFRLPSACVRCALAFRKSSCATLGIQPTPLGTHNGSAAAACSIALPSASEKVPPRPAVSATSRPTVLGKNESRISKQPRPRLRSGWTAGTLDESRANVA